jgi:hypothetical protein
MATLKAATVHVTSDMGTNTGTATADLGSGGETVIRSLGESGESGDVNMSTEKVVAI